MKRILCLRLPNWPLARLVVARPELEGRGVALFSRTARGEPIVACSAAASRLGVRLGMPRSEAESLAPRRGLLVEPHDPAADRATLQGLAAWCEKWSPFVGLEEGEWPKCLLLDLTGIGPLFGGEQKLVERAVQGLREKGYRALAAVGETISAAWAQAWFAEQRAAGSLLGATGSASADVSASDSSAASSFGATGSASEKPPAERRPSLGASAELRRGFLHPDLPSIPLADLPVAALRLEPETLALLRDLGLERIGQLRALPRGALAARFGGDARHQSPASLSALPGEALLLRRLDQLDGLVPEVIQPHRAAPDWEVGWQLEYSTASREVVERVIDQLIAMLADQLAERQREVVRLECRLKLAGADPVNLAVGLSQPSALAAHLAELVHLQLARLSLPGAVMGVTLHAAEIASRAERQQELFPDPSRHDSRQRAWLLDRLTSRLGEDGVAAAQPRGDPLPERAFRLTPLTGIAAARPVRPARRPRKNAAPPVDEVAAPSLAPLHRPVFLTPAQPVAVVAIAPEGAPRRFTLAGQVYDIVRQWGPERIETGWWRGQSVRRDYYRVETTSGEQFWLFRQLTDGGWRLQGVFA